MRVLLNVVVLYLDVHTVIDIGSIFFAPKFAYNNQGSTEMVCEKDDRRHDILYPALKNNGRDKLLRLCGSAVDLLT